MTEFISFDPNAQVLGGNTGALYKAAMEALGVDATPFLEKYGSLSAPINNWTPLQDVLDMFRDIQLNLGNFFGLIAMGSKIPELVPWPDGVDTIEKAFMGMNEAYYMSHQGGEFGNYFPEIIDSRHIRVTAHTPYPSDFDYGICYGLAQRFLPKGSRVFVHRADRPSRIKGDDMCIYDVTWELAGEGHSSKAAAQQA